MQRFLTSEENKKIYNIILHKINTIEDYNKILKFYLPNYNLDKLTNDDLIIIALKIGIMKTNPEDLKYLVKIVLVETRIEIMTDIIDNNIYLKDIPVFTRGELENMTGKELNVVFEMYKTQNINQIIEQELLFIPDKPIELPSLFGLESMLSQLVDSNGQINIGKSQFKMMVEKYGIKDLLYLILWNKEISFPFKKYYLKPRLIFEEIKRYEPLIYTKTAPIRYSPKYLKISYENSTVFKVKEGDYDIIELSDYFMEHNRIKCNNERRGRLYPSVLNYWTTDKLKWVWYDKIPTEEGLNTKVLRESLYKGTSFAECNQFNLLFSRYIIQHLKAKKILDFSSGWGDRLLSALSLNDEIDYYVGVDPNSFLFSSYREMVSFFTKTVCTINTPNVESATCGKYHMINYPFEDAPLPNKRYDLILTSPPFFKFEIYNDQKTQSTSRFTNFNDWIVFFLFTSIKKSCDLLDIGGHLALYISDIAGHYYVEATLLFVEGFLEGMRFKKMIAMEQIDGSTYRPMWIWEKTDLSINKEYREKLNEYYPGIYRKIRL